MHHAVQDVRLAHAAVTYGDREQLVRMSQGTRHGEMLTLTEGTGRCQQARNRPGKMPQQTVFFTESGHHVIHGPDAHLFQRAIEEH